MPKQVLVFKVEVESDNPDGDRLYLQKLRETFRMITEELSPWGFTKDESISFSDIYTEVERA